MKKLQRRVALGSLVLVTLLAAALVLFLWVEEQKDQQRELAAREEQKEWQIWSQEETLENGQVPDAVKNQEMSGTGEVQESLETPNTGEMQEAALQEEAASINLLFTGDIMPGTSVRSNYDDGGIAGILSEYLLQELQGADITMINQEFPFSNRGTPAPDKQFTFRADPSYVGMLQEMGVDVVSLANNHALDYGTDALTDTFATLTEAGIPYVGAGDTKERAAQPVYIECQGKTVGILAASRVIPEVSWNIENQQPGMLCTYDSSALTAAIERTCGQCDYLVVYVHWGVERQEYPEEYQRSLAEAYIDAGADLVIGSHPHVPQGIEYYQGKPIVYSLGNFIFNADMKDTYVLKVRWEADGTDTVQLIPVTASGAFTRELTGQEAQELFRYVESISYGAAIDENGNVSVKP